MAQHSFIDRVAQRRVLRRWAKAARSANLSPLSALHAQRTGARALRTHLDALIHRADTRLALPAIGSDSFVKPHNADWAWRPDLWRGVLPVPGIAGVQNATELGGGISLFHDCPLSEVTLRQVRNTSADDLAPYALHMDVLRFQGSFLSLALDLPDTATRGLKRTHIIRLETRIELEAPIEVFARLNIQHGPNTEKLVCELPRGTEEAFAEFDLAYSNMNEKRVEKAWIDLICESPQMNQVTLRDVTLSRRPRATL